MTTNADTLDLLGQLERHHLAPLWTRMGELVAPQPGGRCAPHRWSYADVRAALMLVGERISTAEAERRVIILENPGMPGTSQITTSLYAGLQVVLPGEVAPAHRHSQSALRFILEGGGGYSVVNGELTRMERGDMLVTAPMAWHDHGNDGDAPAVWLDLLDIPVVRLFDASFAEPAGTAAQPVDRPDGYSAAVHGANMAPLGRDAAPAASPLVRYPYARARAALAKLSATGAPDPYHGHALRYANPLDGGSVLLTIGPCLQFLPRHLATAPYRATDATVLVCVEGTGRTIVGPRTFEWGENDVVVVPSWTWAVHEADEDSVLFSFSDRPAQERLGLWREERATA